MEKQIGFGIVGAGLIAPFHLKAIRDAKGGYAIGIFDVDKARAEKTAKEFNIKTFDSLDQMLADKM
jgi:predicted dehydrogenase